MTAEIRLFPCLNDNFGYLIHDPATNATASIDAPEAGPIIEALEREGWTLTDILVTHHHGDHVGGVAELKQKYECRVVAPHDKTTAIAQVDLRAAQGDVIKVGSLLARVLETPGHTLDHISYVFDGEKALFAADTLFSIGCGRVFEGTYPMMWDSLLKLRVLPDDFRLYCGHEYTAANVKFALTIEPDNPAPQGARRRGDPVARRGQADHPDAARRGEESQRVPARRRTFGRGRGPAERQKRRRGVRRAARAQEQVLIAVAPSLTAADIIAQLGPQATSRGRALSRDVSRWPCRRERPTGVHRDLFPAGARRALALASHRCGRGLALSRRQRLELQIADTMDTRTRPARRRSRRRRTAASHRSGAGLAGRRKLRRLDPGRLHGGPRDSRFRQACSSWRRRLKGCGQRGAHAPEVKLRRQIMSLAAIKPPPAINAAASTMLALGTAKPGQDQERGREQRRGIGRRAEHADIAALHADIPGDRTRCRPARRPVPRSPATVRDRPARP